MRNTTFIVSGEKQVKSSKDSRCVEGEWDMEVGPEVSGCWKSSGVLASSISGVKEGGLSTDMGKRCGRCGKSNILKEP